MRVIKKEMKMKIGMPASKYNAQPLPPSSIHLSIFLKKSNPNACSMSSRKP